MKYKHYIADNIIKAIVKNLKAESFQNKTIKDTQNGVQDLKKIQDSKNEIKSIKKSIAKHIQSVYNECIDKAYTRDYAWLCEQGFYFTSEFHIDYKRVQSLIDFLLQKEQCKNITDRSFKSSLEPYPQAYPHYLKVYEMHYDYYDVRGRVDVVMFLALFVKLLVESIHAESNTNTRVRDKKRSTAYSERFTSYEESLARFVGSRIEIEGKKRFLPYFSLAKDCVHFTPINDFLSTSSVYPNKQIFYFDFTKEPQKNINYPNVFYFQIHKVLYMFYSSIKEYSRQEKQELLSYLVGFKLVNSYNAYGFFRHKPKAVFFTQKSLESLLFQWEEYSYNMAIFLQNIKLQSLVKKTFSRFKKFCKNHSLQEIQELLKLCNIDISARDILVVKVDEKYSGFKKDMKLNLQWLQNPTTLKIRKSQKIIQGISYFLKLITFATKHYDKLYKPKQFHSSYHKWAKNILEIDNGFRTRVNMFECVKAHFESDFARELICTCENSRYRNFASESQALLKDLRLYMLLLDSKLPVKIHYTDTHNLGIFFSNLYDIYHFGRGLSQWRGFAHLMRAYRQKMQHKFYKNKKQNKSIKIKYSKKIQKLESSSILQNLPLCYAALSTKNSEILFEMMIKAWRGENIKNLTLKKLHFTHKELKDNAPKHIESFARFVMKYCGLSFYAMSEGSWSDDERDPVDIFIGHFKNALLGR